MMTWWLVAVGAIMTSPLSFAWPTRLAYASCLFGIYIDDPLLPAIAWPLPHDHDQPLFHFSFCCWKNIARDRTCSGIVTEGTGLDSFLL
jgi:hypothetical protein